MATPILTAVAMLAFAGNSILCRMALEHGLIDPASFATIRTASGAAILGLIALTRQQPPAFTRSDWLPAAMLFAYMVCFSFAYVSLGAGTGALVLFGAVQLTMILAALRGGETLTLLSWFGFGLAIAGLGWLASPGLTAPDPLGALLMAGAGVAWGFYSLLGRRQGDAVMSTTRNFMLAVPLVILVSILQMNAASVSVSGIGLAIASGAITSGLGYVVWYAAVPRLTATRAASVQLTVPVIAAILGVLVLGEAISARLLVASAAILGGVWIVVTQRAARAGRSDSR